MKISGALAAALMVLASCAAAFPSDAATAPKPTLAVELWPADQALNASYKTQEVTFFGRITLGNAPYSKYEVFLDACIDPGWSASCSPDYVTFWGDGSADFQISVTVPQLETDRTARVWVESRATYEDVDVAGNVSGMVHLSVGKLPGNGTGSGSGDRFFGAVSGGSGGTAVLLVSAAIFVTVGFISGVAVWRWKKRHNKQ
jgi:hypothetical protein